jgi:hypothetical protein
MLARKDGELLAEAGVNDEQHAGLLTLQTQQLHQASFMVVCSSMDLV